MDNYFIGFYLKMVTIFSICAQQKNGNYLIMGSKLLIKMVTIYQGWEFAHRISERIARFLPKNEQISDLLKKRAIHSFAHFWLAAWAICSRLLISCERPEQIAHGRSF